MIIIRRRERDDLADQFRGHRYLKLVLCSILPTIARSYLLDGQDIFGNLKLPISTLQIIEFVPIIDIKVVPI